MSNITINPNKIMEFILELEILSNKLDEINFQTSESFDKLNDHWNDEKYYEFKKGIEKINQKVNEDIALIDGTSKIMRELVEKAKIFLRIKP